MVAGSERDYIDSVEVERYMLMVKTYRTPLMLLNVCFLGPILEELVYRGILLNKCRNKGERRAIIISALLFGLGHMNLVQLFSGFFMGLVAGYCFVQTEDIKVPIIIHIVNNVYGTIPDIIMNPHADIENAPGFLRIAIAGCVGTGFLIYGMKRLKC